MEEDNVNISQEGIENEEFSKAGSQSTNSSLKYIFYISVFVLICVIAIVGLEKPDSVEQVKPSPVITESEQLLTSQEVDAARFKLKSNKIASDIEMESGDEQKKAVSSNNSNETYKAESITQEEATKIIEQKDISTQTPAIKTESNGEGITTGEVSIINNDTVGQDTVIMNIEGTVFSNDVENKIITITSNDGTFRVVTTPNTKFIIDNSLFNMRDLKPMDVVTVEGDGYHTSNMIIASTVKVVGVLQIDTINN
ncbi:hypothetical protein H6784_00625 [Candidatus Nomurabacteria bacterium]|nr:hypothetical protein [Candidatus Nomurabacteria bacterium]